MAVTAADFRKLALSLPEAIESAHMGHPDLRVGGKIFATLGGPGKDHAMVKLKPEQQEMYLAAKPKMFAPAAGAWGRAGSTLVQLKAADKATLEAALTLAWRNIAPKRLQAAGEG